MKILVCVLLLFITGCGSMDVTDIKKADQFCADKGGIKTINVVVFGYFCECVNGEEERLSNITLKKENY